MVSSGCEVNQPWLQDGYKKFKDALDSLKCVDYVDEKRTESAFYHPTEYEDKRTNYGLFSRRRSRKWMIPAKKSYIANTDIRII